MRTLRMRQSVRAAALVVGASLIVAGKAAADHVIPDDLIVQGSTCTGLDCVNNESFGFDTLILKENNLRIFFNDTSVTAGYPANDWRLIANSDLNGGGSFFAIQDATATRQVFVVEAGSPLNSIYVDSTGRVGFRTSTPVLDLHVNTSNTPAMRLEQNSGGGFTAQTWDIAGNEANFFVRDVTGGSRLPFRIRPGAPTSSIDISADGDVGVGTASPNAKLHVRSAATGTPTNLQLASGGTANTDAAVLDFTNSSNAVNARIFVDSLTTQSQMRIKSLGELHFHAGNIAISGTNDFMTILTNGNVGIGTTAPAARFHTTGTVRLAGVTGCGSGIISNGSGDLSCLGSSRQLKNVVGDLAPNVALANVMALRPQVGSYKQTPDEPEHWLIAEEVAAVDAALVGRRGGEPHTVKLQGIVTDLIAVIQQQQRRIEALERAVAR